MAMVTVTELVTTKVTKVSMIVVRATRAVDKVTAIADFE
jgi:hypothetical protein